MDWSHEKVFTLVSLYEEHQCLWNVRCSSYKNTNEKHDSLQKIAFELGITSIDVEKKIKSLVAQYRREKRKIEESKKSGSGTESVYDPKWFGFKALQFLDDVHEPKKTRDTILAEVSEDILPEEDRGEEETAAAEAAPPLQKRVKRGGGKIDPIGKAAAMLENLLEKQQQDNDSAADFGRLVASKLRELPPYRRTVARKRLYDVLYEEELKSFENNQNIPSHAAVSGESSSSSMRQSPCSTPDSPLTFIGTLTELSNEEVVYIADDNDS